MFAAWEVNVVVVVMEGVVVVVLIEWVVVVVEVVEVAVVVGEALTVNLPSMSCIIRC